MPSFHHSSLAPLWLQFSHLYGEELFLRAFRGLLFIFFLGVQQPGSVHQTPRVLLCLVSDMKRSCHVG